MVVAMAVAVAVAVVGPKENIAGIFKIRIQVQITSLPGGITNLRSLPSLSILMLYNIDIYFDIYFKLPPQLPSALTPFAPIKAFPLPNTILSHPVLQTTKRTSPLFHRSRRRRQQKPPVCKFPSLIVRSVYMFSKSLKFNKRHG